MKQFRNSRYWVTEDGEVSRYYPKTIKYYSYTYSPYVTKEHYNIVKPQTVAGGYQIICLYFGDGKESRQQLLLHRMVAEIYVPGYFEGAEVDHIDCNIQNNHYTNLQWCTPDYNKRKGNNPTFPLYSEWNK